jgi:demethylmenaquinone methyltransferase/2-methoxy-6-polyprenyl-1,4-benzoquinol methylase
VTGIDLSGAMMGIARYKARERGVSRFTLARADVLRLPFADGAFSGVATAFTLRNVADLPAALAEIWRVLRPGARFACLEITRPRGGLMARLFTLYFQRLVPVAGAIITGNRGAYRYLPESVDRFVTGDELITALHAAGFEQVRMRRFWPGALTLHVGSRSP